MFSNLGKLQILTAHNWQKLKKLLDVLSCPCHSIYMVEAVGRSHYALKITIFENVWNLGQFRENLIFCQYLLN